MGVTVVSMFRIEIFLMLLSLWGAQGRDGLDTIASDDYWKIKQVQVTRELLESFAVAGAEVVATSQPADIKELIVQLGDESYTVRQAARTKLATYGVAAQPALQEASRNRDPEVASSAKELLDNLTAPGGRERAIRQLMAIRTLGERKDPAALPTLQKLMASKTPFVAEYAQKAIATIQNKPVTATAALDLATLANDAKRMPETLGAFGVVRPGFAPKRSVPDLIRAMSLTRGRQIDDNQIATMQDSFNTNVIAQLELTGNWRVDGFSFGMSKEISNHRGWVVFTWHGQFDKSALLEQVAAARRQRPDNVDAAGVKDEVLVVNNELAVIMPSDRELTVVLAGPGERENLATLAQEYLDRARGKTTPTNHPACAELSKTVPADAQAWLAVWSVSTELQEKLKVINGIEKGIAWATRKADGNMVAQLSATWSDEATLTTAIADTENLTKNLLTQIDKELERRPLAKDGLSGGAKIWLESLVLTPKTKQLTAKMDISAELLGQFMGMMTNMLPMRSTTRVAPVPRE